MLRRRKHPVLAEVPKRRDGARRAALGRADLEAFSGLAGTLASARAILTTGPARSEAALGVAAAALADGRRVALLECDIASPGHADMLGLAATPGFHEYLRDEADAAQILQPLVLAGPASGGAVEPLACIVAGEPEPNPVALLDSERCDHAVERLRNAYELLVISGPALSEDPDSLKGLGALCNATLACGARGELPKRFPVSVTGLVLFG